MKNIFVMFLVGFGFMAGAVAGTPYSPEVDARFNKLEGGDSAFQARAGLMPRMQAVGIWDYSKQGGSSAASFSLGASLPKNALITRSYVYVPTQVTGTTDTGGNKAQMSFKCESTGDLLAATDFPVRIPNHEYSIDGVQTGASALFVKSDGCALTGELTYGNFTAGKIILFVDYVVR